MAHKTLTGLVLQGGGSLGAYEHGLISGLFEQKPDLELSIVTGISIGALNAAVLVGGKSNTPAHPVKALDELWERLTLIDWPFMPQPIQSNLAALGNPSMYAFRPETFLTPTMTTSIYDTTPLKNTLNDLIDFDKLNKSQTKVAVMASNIETGEVETFGNEDGKMRVEHILASGSLPPGFPMTEIDGSFYWDGGLILNTPLGPVINHLEALEGDYRQIIVVELFPMKASIPSNMNEVFQRMIEMTFSSKLNLDRDLINRVNSFIDLAQEIDKEVLPESKLRQNKGFKKLIKHKKINELLTVVPSSPEPMGASDFSKATLERRFKVGRRDGLKAAVSLAKAEKDWLESLA